MFFFGWANHIFSKALECEIRKAQIQKGWNIANDLSKGRVRSWRERSLSSLLSRGWRSRCQAARASIRWISWRASQPGPTAYGPISTGLSDWREFLKLFLPEGTKERYSWKLGSLGHWDLNKIFFLNMFFLCCVLIFYGVLLKVMWFSLVSFWSAPNLRSLASRIGIIHAARSSTWWQRPCGPVIQWTTMPFWIGSRLWC